VQGIDRILADDALSDLLQNADKGLIILAKDLTKAMVLVACEELWPYVTLEGEASVFIAALPDWREL
jgi:hypothetical protein